VDYGRAVRFPGYTKTNLVASYQAWQRERQSARIYAPIENLFDGPYYVSGYGAAGAAALGGIAFSF
jgi:hypothetical protein